MSRACTKCAEVKPLNEFGRRSDAPDKPRSWCFVCEAAHRREYAKRNPEAIRAAKRRYYSTEKGKACKRREDAAYAASGGRAISEAARDARPLSPARRAARQKWSKNNTLYWATQRALRRGMYEALDEFGKWVMLEAQKLARLRGKMTGFPWEVDHVVPVTLGGTSEPNNLQVVPARWNKQKSNKHQRRFFGAFGA